LALGTGANTAMFTLLRGTLLKPLPNRNGNDILYIRQPAPGFGTRNASFSILDGEGHPTVINAGVVSGNYFSVMGLRPELGRLTNTEDDGPSAASVTVLSHSFWMDHFGGDASVIGRRI